MINRKLITFNDIFDESCINIFADGSIKKLETTGETIGCSGAIMTYYDGESLSIINKKFGINRESTNNDTEIKSILLGIELVLDLYNRRGRQDATINIFSDSKICVMGLTSWYNNWLKAIHNGVMYSSSGEPVANQYYFTWIMSLILQNNLSVNLFHQKGHVNVNIDSHIEKAMKVFNESNAPFYTNDKELIKAISDLNNHIDIITGEEIERVCGGIEFAQRQSRIIIPVTISPSFLNANQYKKLIGK